MAPKEAYSCPACGYKTTRKHSMRVHFYNNKKPCPRIVNDIDLTDEIKEYVLDNRVYHPPKQQASSSQQILNQTINNYNVIQNFITNMDVIDKLNKYAEYNKIEIIDFEDKVGENYMLTCKRLDDDKFKYGFELKTHDILEIIDSISSMPDNKLEYFNIMYDNHINKLKLYEGGVWKSLLIEQGIRQIIIITKDYYLDSYESYLLRKLRKSDSPIEKQKVKELLIEYYKFIAAFEIDPYIKDASDGMILSDDEKNSECNYHDEYYPIYQKVMDKLTKGEMVKVKKDVLEIVKRNTNQNIHELNKRVLGLIHMDEDFKSIVVKNINQAKFA